MANETEYWAALPAGEVVQKLEEKHSDWDEYNSGTGLKRKWITSYNYYFGRHFKNSSSIDDTDLMRGGREGELTLIKANHYRNVIRHILAMTTQQLPSFECRAANSDVDSINQTRLGGNIVDYYFQDKRINRNVNDSAEHSCVFGTGFTYVKWDKSAGETYQVDNGREVKNGDVEVSSPSVFDVMFDQAKEDFSKVDWVDIREHKNKFDLAARYAANDEELRAKIIGLESKNEKNESRGATLTSIDETCDVPVYAFYHKRTDAMPNGRFILYCSSDVILLDGPIPYKRLPIFQIVPGRFFGSAYGYSDSFDLLGIQEALNTLMSTVLSNQVAFGTQNVLVPEGANLSRESLSESLSFIKYNPAAGKPEPLQLTATAPEIFNFIDKLDTLFEVLSGVNSVARGEPDASLKSGVALSLVQSMAIQFTSAFQRSWAELLEDVGTFILELLQDYAETERMITIAGKLNRGYMKSFSKKDIFDVKRVVVKLGNPMARTTSGRVQIADNLLQKGLIKNPQEYLTVMETGTLDPLTQHQDARTSLIRAENEAIMEGRFDDVHVLTGDQHVLHSQEHLALLSNPIVRSSSNITAFVLQHVKEHEDLYQNQAPFYALLSGEPPAQPQLFMTPQDMQQQLPPPGMPPQGMQDQGMAPPPPMNQEMPPMPMPDQNGMNGLMG